MQFTFTVMFRPEPEGGYTAMVPSLPGCISYGETLEEANTMIQEAMELYLESVHADNGEVIDDRHILEKHLSVAMAI
jgi:predicted RNase H-like HicB family nuclease